jgi:hypothetical protein
LQSSVVHGSESSHSGLVVHDRRAVHGAEPQPLPPSQICGTSPTHSPPEHVSPLLQEFESSHGVPSGLAGSEQTPVLVSHVPASWHWSIAVHTTGSLPTHAPDWQVSVCVQALPSLQLEPFAT